MAEPSDFPFTIHRISQIRADEKELWLIRERDRFGASPHIYAKICPSRVPGYRGYIVLSSTGCGTEVESNTITYTLSETQQSARPVPRVWNLRTFLEYHLNPEEVYSYIIISTNCHFDQILGLRTLLAPVRSHPQKGASKLFRRPAQLRVCVSNNAGHVISSTMKLRRHSLCDSIDMNAPEYVGHCEWTPDGFDLVSSFSDFGVVVASMDHCIKMFHTDGHSLDSLS